MENLYFWIFATVATCCGFGVLTVRHPITAAVNLIGVMLSLAGIYALLNAPFLGIIQILVYTGAIMMLVVFVIMVVGGAHDKSTPRGGGLPAVVGLVSGLTMVCLVAVVLGRTDLSVDEATVHGTAAALGGELFTFADGRGWYILFEVVGLILLAAMVGAVLLAKRSL
ncbi:MAG: NADH-quinone oxidoreductase subunit J family protein, partial [Planctomycetota bacterium]